MSMDRNYLEYPHRHHGMDHDRYAWSMLADREPVRWPQGKPLPEHGALAAFRRILDPLQRDQGIDTPDRAQRAGGGCAGRSVRSIEGKTVAGGAACGPCGCHRGTLRSVNAHGAVSPRPERPSPDTAELCLFMVNRR